MEATGHSLDRSLVPPARDPVILPYGSGVWTIFVGSFICLIFALCLRVGAMNGWWIAIGNSFTYGVFLSCVLSGETQISQSQRTVVRLWRFVGIVPVWRRTYFFDDFRGIQRRHNGWAVGLLADSGCFIPLRCVLSLSVDGVLADAETYLKQAAEITGLPVLDAGPGG